MIEKLLCHHKKTLLDALQIINENAKGAVFIVDDQKKLCGILTDGDLRRLILDGHKLQELIEKVISKKPIFVRIDDPKEDILQKLNDSIRILPVVDKSDVVVDFVEYKGDIHFPLIAPNLNGNELKYLLDAFLSTWISSQGKYINMFEEKFASYIGCKHGVAVSNGTTALHLALLACQVGPGDEVIVPDLTFAATINVVLHAGARPVIVDIEKESWGLDPREVEKAITSKTKAIIPVHLYGQPCEIAEIMRIAKKHSLYVIEDCAEAHGATFDGKKAGSFGDISCFSFFGNKIITTGEGGMCVTNSKELDARMRLLRDHGMSRERKYWHEAVGYNYRMTNLQAAIGVAQLERIDEILLNRKSVEGSYRKEFAGISSLEFQRNDLPHREKITWLVSVLVKNGQRDRYMQELKKNGVDTRPFFASLSAMDIYKDFLFSNKVSQKISAEGINFPTGVSQNKEIMDKIRMVVSADL